MQVALNRVETTYSTSSAFVAVLQDGMVVTWGNKSAGVDSRSVQAALDGVANIYSTDRAFAAVLKNWTVVTRNGMAGKRNGLP